MFLWEKKKKKKTRIYTLRSTSVIPTPFLQMRASMYVCTCVLHMYIGMCFVWLFVLLREAGGFFLVLLAFHFCFGKIIRQWQKLKSIQ